MLPVSSSKKIVALLNFLLQKVIIKATHQATKLQPISDHCTQIPG